MCIDLLHVCSLFLVNSVRFKTHQLSTSVFYAFLHNTACTLRNNTLLHNRSARLQVRDPTKIRGNLRYYAQNFARELYLLLASIHCYHSAFPTTRQHSVLPFSIPYYTLAFTAPIQYSLLHVSIHCYHSAFPTTRQHSLLPFSIPYYMPAFTATIQHSLLHASIHCYHSAFPTTRQHSLIAFRIPYSTIQHSLLHTRIHCYMKDFLLHSCI